MVSMARTDTPISAPCRHTESHCLSGAAPRAPHLIWSLSTDRNWYRLSRLRSEVFYGYFQHSSGKNANRIITVTFCFSISLHLPSSYFIHNGILRRKPFHSLRLVCCYPATMWNADFMLLRHAFSYTGLREDPFGSQCFIRYLYTILHHSSINHYVKLHAHINFSLLLPYCFIYFVPVWSWPKKGLEDIEEWNRVSGSSWSEIAS